jgi:D-inositol-3-phosphate glycosyltransferase
VHVALVLAEADSGRASTIELSNALTAAGHEVEVFGADAATRGTAQDDLAAYTAGLREAWAMRTPDVVHAQSWLSGMAALSAAHGPDIPVVQSFGAGTDPRNAEVRKLVPVLARRAGWMAASNTAQLLELLNMGCARSRLSVIPAGVDRTLFTPPGPVAPRGAARHRVVSMWSPSTPVDQAMIVTTLTAIPDTEWVVAVDPVDAEAAGSTVRTMAEAAGVGDRLTVQQVDDGHQLAALLRSADAFGCPVTADPTGFTTLRAMSCGIPVVGTAVGALVDIVVDDVTGWLVPAGETLKFVDAMRRLLHEPFAGRGMGGAGRDRACSRYSWERVATDALRAYTGALDQVRAVTA